MVMDDLCYEALPLSFFHYLLILCPKHGCVRGGGAGEKPRGEGGVNIYGCFFFVLGIMDVLV